MVFSHGKLIAAMQYFTSIVEDYWHILYPLVPIEKIKNDKYLYLYDISRKATTYKGDFSKDGIYLFYGYDGKYHLHALELAQYSLACWLAWKNTNDENWAKKALFHCNWMLENQEHDGAWRINHKNPVYNGLPASWPSALCQGLAISSLVRGYYYTNQTKYLECAQRAASFLEIDVDSGGVKKIFNQSDINGFVYEEYPRKKLNGVLNGYISSVIGLYELSNIDFSYKALFDSNILDLKKILPLYDAGYWSYYSLDKNIDSGFYHRYVIIQLKALSYIDNYFNEYAKQFEKYQNNFFFILKALYNKTKSKL